MGELYEMGYEQLRDVLLPGEPAGLELGIIELDDGTEQGEVLFMEGQVRDVDGKPVAGAVIDVWHANTKGGYSFFDPSQEKYNLRRRIETDAEGRYRFRSILPAGYACPPGGVTQQLLVDPGYAMYARNLLMGFAISGLLLLLAKRTFDRLQADFAEDL